MRAKSPGQSIDPYIKRLHPQPDIHGVTYAHATQNTPFLYPFQKEPHPKIHVVTHTHHTYPRHLHLLHSLLQKGNYNDHPTQSRAVFFIQQNTSIFFIGRTRATERAYSSCPTRTTTTLKKGHIRVCRICLPHRLPEQA
jgi:hypothetical protein